MGNGSTIVGHYMEIRAIEVANADLATPAALLALLERVGLGGGVGVSEIGLRLTEFEALRSAVRELLDASVGGGPLPAAAVRRLNETSGRIPRALELGPDATAVERELGGARNPSARILAEIARSAIELLGSQRDRVRRCPACGSFFVTTRMTRTWCSEACGNRTRVARHHARARAMPAEGR
jgi:predicted RNA-binding Zn ribbon-like protein